jgi:hypothetical protein
MSPAAESVLSCWSRKLRLGSRARRASNEFGPPLGNALDPVHDR